MTERIAAHAGRGEILASPLVADLAAGSGLHFVEPARIAIDGLDEPLALVQR